MVGVAVCHNEPHILQQFREWLARMSDRLEIQITSDYYQEVETLLNALRQRMFYQIIFINVEMKKEDGRLAGCQIRTYDKRVLIIYISRNENYAAESLRSKPFDCLIKPLAWNRFEQVFQQAYDEILKYRRDFVFATKRKEVHLPIWDVLYFQSRDKNVEAVLEHDMVEFRAKLDTVEDLLHASDYQFIRIHKSYLVNYYCIKMKKPDLMELNGGTKLQISRSMKKTADEQYRKAVCWASGHRGLDMGMR